MQNAFVDRNLRSHYPHWSRHCVTLNRVNVLKFKPILDEVKVCLFRRNCRLLRFVPTNRLDPDAVAETQASVATSLPAPPSALASRRRIISENLKEYYEEKLSLQN